MDFVDGQSFNATKVRVLTVVDAFTRLSSAPEMRLPQFEIGCVFERRRVRASGMLADCVVVRSREQRLPA